jgi:hypothetical protein
MNNHEIIKNELTRIITERIYDVSILKGEWGIGKTFLWETVKKGILNNPQLNKNYSNDSFIYISLFGLNSIDEVKNKLVFRTDSKKKLFETFKSLKELKLLNGFLPVSALTIPIGSIFEYFIDNSLKNKIIVFDDIERKNNSFDILSLLGLINQLKAMGSQFLIMLNEEKIDDNVDKNWHLFKEKIIDIEYRLDSSEKYCFDIIINHLNKKQYDLLTQIEKEIIEAAILNLKIKNIRIGSLIFRKSIEILKELKSLIKEENKEFFFSIIQNITKIFYLYYTTENKINFNDINNFISKYSTWDDRQQIEYFNKIDSQSYPLSDNDKLVINKLEEMNFSLNKNITLIVLDYIKNGILQKELLNKSFSNIAAEIDLFNNDFELNDFLMQLYFNAKITEEDITERINIFLTLPYKDYGLLHKLYIVMQQINYEIEKVIFNKLIDLMREKKWVPSEKILNENAQFRIHFLAYNNTINPILENLTLKKLINEHQFNSHQVETILNSLSENQLKDLLLKEENLREILNFIKFITDNKNLAKFNKTFDDICTYFKNSSNPDYLKMKRVLLLFTINK